MWAYITSGSFAKTYLFELLLFIFMYLLRKSSENSVRSSETEKWLGVVVEVTSSSCEKQWGCYGKVYEIK